MKNWRPLTFSLRLLCFGTAISMAAGPALAAGKPTYANKMEIGQLLYFNGDVDRAINAFRTAGELNPKAFEPHLNLVNLYIQKGTPENLSLAAEECREVLKRKPSNRDVHLILSNILRTEASSETDAEVRKKKMEEAITEAEEAQKLGANEALCENQIGVIKLQLDDTDGALTHIDAAIKKQNNFPDAHLIRGVLLFKKLTAVQPGKDAAALLKELQTDEGKKKQIKEIIDELDTSISQKNGINAEAYSTKADIMFALGRHDDAIEAYTKAADQDARSVNSLAGLGNAHAQLATTADESKKGEHISKAKDAYSKAKKLKPNDKNIVYGLAVMLEKMGNVHEAVQEFNDGLMLETDPQTRYQIQQHVQQLMGAAGIGTIGNFGSIGGGGVGSGMVGQNIFTSGALSTPFKDLIKIKAPPGKEEKSQ